MSPLQVPQSLTYHFQRFFHSANDVNVALPTGVPILLIVRKFPLTVRLTRVFNLENEILPSPSAEDVGTSLADLVKRLHASSGLTQGFNYLGLVPISFRRPSHSDSRC
jgi:hypothetical protein